jgi:hypothetical protein
LLVFPPPIYLHIKALFYAFHISSTKRWIGYKIVGMVLLIFVVSIDSMNVREVGELRWGRSIGVSAEVWPIYIHFYRDTGGHEYVVTNLLGGGVAMINIDDPSNPYVASVALADTTVFKFPTMVDGAGVVDVGRCRNSRQMDVHGLG